MKYKNFFHVIFLSLILFSIVFCSIINRQIVYGTPNTSQQYQNIIKAIDLQCQNSYIRDQKMQVNADSMSIVDENALNKRNFSLLQNNKYPSTFDLRNCDLDGTGDYKNYVTSVKMQSPWSTCWAFAGIAASETSILSKLRQNATKTNPDGTLSDTLDLSEHHLSWFNYSPILESEVPSQAGEGAYSMKEQEEKEKENPYWLNYRLGTGGACMSTTSSFANGFGVVKEPDFNDPTSSNITRQLLYKNLNDKIDKSKGVDMYSTEDDWSVDYSLRFSHDYNLEQGIVLPDARGESTGDYDINNAKIVTSLMKDQLLQGRALNIAYCGDSYMPGSKGRTPKYINVDTWAHYTYEKVPSNHLVTVVGWDDSYKKENFLTEIPDPEDPSKKISVPQPPEDGAWIVKNSWGSGDSWGQGLNIHDWGLNNSGYFYLSYFDRSLNSEEAYDFDIEGKTSSASILNQHDYMPCEKVRGIEQNDFVAAANVFEAKQTQDITQISSTISADNEFVTYKIYKLADKSMSIDDGQLLYQTTQQYQNKGFYRVCLDKSLRMNKGDIFAIVKEEKSNNSFLIGVSCDYNKAGYDAKMPEDRYYCNGIVNSGESYMYTSDNKQWTDFSIIKKDLESKGTFSKYFSFDNFSIKAYGVPVDEPISPDTPPSSDSVIETYTSASTGDFLNVIITAICISCIVISVFLIRKNFSNTYKM